jgi:hypothetical protein
VQADGVSRSEGVSAQGREYRIRTDRRGNIVIQAIAASKSGVLRKGRGGLDVLAIADERGVRVAVDVAVLVCLSLATVRCDARGWQ